MNNDLISRERLKNTILLGNYDTQSKILSAIDNAPTVEPEITEKQAILFLINNGWLVNHDKELRERWERPQGKWGKWIISEVQCPHCFEYFDPDCYAKGELDKCPCCGTYLMGGAEQ